MRLIEIRNGQYWGLFFCGQAIVRKLIFIRMSCDDFECSIETPDNIIIKEINEKEAIQLNKMKYRVKQFFSENKENFYGLVAYEEGVPCGYVCGCKQYGGSHEEYEFYIKYVYVEPRCRGKRISTMLISKLANDLQCLLYLNCRANNDAALKVYKKIGFKAISRREEVYFPVVHKGITTSFVKISNDEI